MHLHLFSLGLTALTFLAPLISASSYWISPNCITNLDMPIAIQESIRVADQVKNALERREGWLEEYLKWTFGFGYDHGHLQNVIEVFNRIANLKMQNDRGSAIVRFHCDNENRFRPQAFGEGIQVLVDFPDGPDRSDSDECVTSEEGMGCKDKGDGSRSAYAATITGCHGTYNLFNSRNDIQSTQHEDRTPITLCDVMSKVDPEKVGHDDVAFSFTEAAQKNWEGQRVQLMTPIAALVVTHEFVHVRAIGRQTFTSSGDPFPALQQQPAGGEDFHGNGDDTSNPRMNGYWEFDDEKTLGEKFAGHADYAVMNCDSYAFLAGLYRMRGKQWKAVRPGETGFVTFTKDETLPMESLDPINFTPPKN